MRLIDADALLERFKKTDRYFAVKYDIEQAPTIERPHGEWIFTSNPNYSPFDESSEDTKICSGCSFKYSYKPVFNFCPNCGARMKVDKEVLKYEKPNKLKNFGNW